MDEILKAQVLLVIAASVVPTIAMLTVSYFQAIGGAKTNLQDIINSATVKTENLISVTDQTLRRNNKDLQDADTETAARILRRQVYNDYRFRETGIINKDGLLTLTSLGIINPPVPISPIKARFNPGKPELQILGLGRSRLMQEESIVMMLKGSGTIGSTYMLVDPVLLTDFLKLIAELDLGPQGYIAYVTQDDQLLSSIGIGISQEEILSNIKNPSRDTILASQATKDGNIKIIAETKRKWVLRFWNQELLISIPITFLVSTLLVGLFIRELRKPNSLDDELKRGLINKEFEIHYQPIIDLKTRQCVGAEALMRWHHPKRGLIYPGVFIPIAEQTGLIGPMTEWLLAQAIQDQEFLRQRFPDLYTSINLSPTQLNTGDVSHLIQILKTNSASRALITFEITENEIVEEQWEIVKDAIAHLKRWGVQLAIDDFGMGYSNIAYLQRLDVDQLKLDKIFIQGLDAGNDIAQLVDGLIDFGDRFKLRIVAEGIENEKQFEYLRDRGVAYGQGWLFSAALPLDEYLQFLQAQDV